MGKLVLIQQCRDFIPDSTRASLADIKSKLSKAVDIGASSKTRNLRSAKEKPKLEDSLRELSNDAAIFQKKIDAVLEAVVCMVDTVGSYNDNFDERLSKIESRLTKIENSPKPSGNSKSFATIASSEKSEVNNERLSKLEFQASEDDRKKKLLQATFTHPSINKNSSSIKADISIFFRDKMKMEAREIDQNFIVHKSSRVNTVVVTFSDRRFKLFAYKARKKLRDESEENVSDLYINDNLTTFNFSMLMQLKRIRAERKNSNKVVFETVYTIEGKVFVKMHRADSNDEAKYIKSEAVLDEFIRSLDTNESAPSTSSP